MNWRITGTELVAPGETRRACDVAWVGGLVGTDWVLAEVRALDGKEQTFPPVGPVFTVDASDPVSTYWAVLSLLYEAEVSGDPVPALPDETPEGAVN